jgi:hypothetical protein
LILSSHSKVYLASDLFIPSFPKKILYAVFIFPLLLMPRPFHSRWLYTGVPELMVTKLRMKTTHLYRQNSLSQHGSANEPFASYCTFCVKICHWLVCLYACSFHPFLLSRGLRLNSRHVACQRIV